MLNPLRTAFHHNASTLCECVRACDSRVVQCWILSLLFLIHFAFFVTGLHSHSNSRRLVLLLCVPSRVCMGACVRTRHLIFHSLYLLYMYRISRICHTSLCVLLYGRKRDVLLYTCDVYMRAQSNNNYKRARSFSFVRSLIVAGCYCTLAIFHCSFLLPSFFFYSMRESNNCSLASYYNSVLFCVWTLMHIHTRATSDDIPTISPIYHICLFVSF